MPNIGIHGFDSNEAKGMEKKIRECLQKIGLSREAITEVFETITKSCDGENAPMPYLRIFSSEFENVSKILTGFYKHGIHEDIEVVSKYLLFFSKDEMISGSWINKYIRITGTRIKK